MEAAGPPDRGVDEAAIETNTGPWVLPPVPAISSREKEDARVV